MRQKDAITGRWIPIAGAKWRAIPGDCPQCGGPKAPQSHLCRKCRSLKRRADAPIRFWEKVNKNGVTVPHMLDNCWEWTGSFGSRGYGHFTVGSGTKQNVRAHVFSYKTEVGEIPNGLLILHHCDNKKCVRPSHLYAGTAKDNMRDCIERGRFAGPKVPKASAREEDAKEKDSVKETQQNISQ